MFCQEEVARAGDRLEDVRALGGEMIVVGSGTPEQARRFVDDFHLKMPVVTDPTLEAYRRAGMKRSVLGAIGPGVLLRGAKILAKGFRQHRQQGDNWQQGGVVVMSALDRGGRVTMQQAADAAGKPPTDFARMVEAVREAAGPSSPV